MSPQTDTGEDLSDPLLSKGGKQNVDNEYVRMIQYKENGDKYPCEWLRELYNKTNNTQERRKIKTAQKHYNCDGKDRYKKSE